MYAHACVYILYTCMYVYIYMYIHNYICIYIFVGMRTAVALIGMNSEGYRGPGHLRWRPGLRPVPDPARRPGHNDRCSHCVLCQYGRQPRLCDLHGPICWGDGLRVLLRDPGYDDAELQRRQPHREECLPAGDAGDLRRNSARHCN